MKRILTIVLSAILLIGMLTTQAYAVFDVAEKGVGLQDLQVCNNGCQHVYNVKAALNLDENVVYEDSSLIDSIDMTISVRKEKNGQVLVILSIPTTEATTKVDYGSITISYSAFDMSYASISGYLFGETISSLSVSQINEDDPEGATIEISVSDTGSKSHSLPTLLRLYFNPIALHSVSDQSTISVYGSATSSSPIDATYTINEVLQFAYCAHNRTYTITTVQPTCSREGVATTYCEDCHLAISETYLARTDHSYPTKPARVLKAATCSSEGQGEFVCTVCHQTGYAKIAKLDHKFGIPYTKNGSYYVRCSVCGAEELASKQCDHADTAYEYVSTSKEPTCVEKGIAIYKCKVCGQLQYIDLELVSHTWVDIETITEATPTQAGLKKQRCLVCGLVESHEYIYHVTHTYEGREEIVVEATCETAGSKRIYCTGCNEFKTVEIAALGHNWSEWVTESVKSCTTDGVQSRTCSRCGKEEQKVEKAEGHKWSEWTVMVEPSCTNPGRRTRYCSVCNQSEFAEIAQRAHTFNAEDYKVVSSPTCVSKGLERCICAECKTATNDREIEIDPNAHNYSEWSVVTKATCLTEGLDTRACSYCGKVETRITPKVGHTYVELTEKGVTTKTCSVCKTVETIQQVKGVATYTEQSGVIKLTITSPSGEIFFLTTPLDKTDITYTSFVAPFEGALTERNQSIDSAYQYKLTIGNSDGTLNAANKVQIVLDENYSKIDIKVWYLTESGSLVPVDEKLVKRSKNTITIQGDGAFNNCSNVIVLTNAGTYSGTSVALPIAIAVVTILIVAGLVIFLRFREKKNSTEIKDENE